MAVERTFSIIKPDATRRNLTGKINARFEDAACHDGLRLAEIHARLDEIGAASAPSRAASILHGLGFDNEKQARIQGIRAAAGQ